MTHCPPSLIELLQLWLWSPPQTDNDWQKARKAFPPLAGSDPWRTDLDRALKTEQASDLQLSAARGLRLCDEAVSADGVGPAPRSSSGTLDQSALTKLKGCGPKTAQNLLEAGIDNLTALAMLLPVGYEDFRNAIPIEKAEEGMTAAVTGDVHKVVWVGPPGRRHLELHVSDDDARLVCVWFRLARGMVARLHQMDRITVAGKIYRYRNRLQISHPRILDPHALPGLMAKYPAIEGIGDRRLGLLCRQAVDAAPCDDALPAEITDPLGLPDLPSALRFLHDVPTDLPEDQTALLLSGRHPAQRRVLFSRIFSAQLELAHRRMSIARDPAPICTKPVDITQMEQVLEFRLTASQQRVIHEIHENLESGSPMQRLLQGDVGSGKTAVAFAAAASVLFAGYQVAFMAPTELLVQQQTTVLSRWSKKLGFSVLTLTGRTPKQAKASVKAIIESGKPVLIVGTHALISASVSFGALGLVVVDEQHRFGVLQRFRLRCKADGTTPHLLVMTATPIPRTLALTLYGDLDVSVIDELPPGRLPVQTERYTYEQRGDAWKRLKTLVEDEKRQAYVVCPLVSDSDEAGLADAEQTAKKLARHFPDVGLVHGRMDPAAKEQVIEAFRRGLHRVLVATTVIEVGMDVPSAAVIVVLNAERFGLAQLHQLRGRVGRSRNNQGSCLLLTGPKATCQAAERIDTLVRTNDGFEVAQADLEHRGPGELAGRRQSGQGSIRLDHDSVQLLATAQRAARALLTKDPNFEKHPQLRRRMEQISPSVFGAEAG
ncbi:MAG: ATP-dependent DNA helicase RecG [Deltaproteobacteria bacterium]|nr:ATP-dependent DNA helicase RecG [Deltaproteobacteria bacterium]